MAIQQSVMQHESRKKQEQKRLLPIILVPVSCQATWRNCKNKGKPFFPHSILRKTFHDSNGKMAKFFGTKLPSQICTRKTRFSPSAGRENRVYCVRATTKRQSSIRRTFNLLNCNCRVAGLRIIPFIFNH